jgi:hypothetical protein
MAGFIFGGNTGIADPGQLQRRREILDALGQKAQAAAPRSVGEGLSAIGQALAFRIGNKRLESQEAKARTDAQAGFGRVTSALLGGQSYASPFSGASTPPVQGVTTPPVQSSPVTENPAGLDPSIIAAVDRVDPQGPEAAIRAGLIERGMPPHIADGFVMNFKDESGLNPGINETDPVVPGSRGGFGLAQWTGPRRVALEKFAAERGASPADTNVQLDFLMTELQGPEAGAARSILAADDAGSAAAAIATDFLRPAPEHLSRRVAEYTGGFSTPGTAPNVNPQIFNQLAELAANPYLPEGQRAVVNALMQKEMDKIGQKSDPMKAIELAQARLDYKQDIAGGGASDMPTGYRELQLRAEAAGLVPGTPEFQEFMLTGGSGIGEGRPAAFEALHQQALAAGLVEGSPEYKNFMLTKGAGEAAAARAEGAALGEDTALLNSMESKLPGLEKVVEELTALSDSATYTMGGQAVNWVGKQLGLEPREEAIARTEYIAKVDNQVLPMLRDTFGAAFTVAEGETLRATLGDPNKSPQEKKAVLRAFIAQKKRDVEALRMRVTPAVLDASGVPNGVDPDVWEVMTPEEKALFQ